LPCWCVPPALYSSAYSKDIYVDHLGDSEHEVLLWSRDEILVDHFNTHHRNPTCLHEHVFPESIVAVGPELPDAETIAGVDVLLFAIPTEGVR
jgi:glycerol-3-phosphate dehydrogenase